MIVTTRRCISKPFLIHKQLRCNRGVKPLLQLRALSSISIQPSAIKSTRATISASQSNTSAWIAPKQASIATSASFIGLLCSFVVNPSLRWPGWTRFAASPSLCERHFLNPEYRRVAALRRPYDQVLEQAEGFVRLFFKAISKAYTIEFDEEFRSPPFLLSDPFLTHMEIRHQMESHHQGFYLSLINQLHAPGCRLQNFHSHLDKSYSYNFVPYRRFRFSLQPLNPISASQKLSISASFIFCAFCG